MKKEEILSTTNYELFKLSESNRAKGVTESHVMRLIFSIEKKNLLYLRPIVVDKDYTIIDGQHRFEACKRLKIPVYYTMGSDLSLDDVIAFNAITKPWTSADYLHFFVKQGLPEYVKLDAFIKKSGMTISTLLSAVSADKGEEHKVFKEGKFKFDEELVMPIIDIIHRTVDMIYNDQKLNHIKTGKALKAMIWLFNQPEFNEEKWFFNLQRHTSKIFPRTNTMDYKKIFVGVFNWRNQHKIVLEDFNIKEE